VGPGPVVEVNSFIGGVSSTVVEHLMDKASTDQSELSFGVLKSGCLGYDKLHLIAS
jgi:hypothetical protein